MGFELLILAVALGFAVPAIQRRLRSAADPEWARRWEETPQLEQERISTAVRRGERLADPDEAALALGLAHEQRKSAALLAQPSLAHLVLGAALLLELRFGSPPLVFSLTLLVLAYFIWLAYHDRITKRNLTHAEEAAIEAGAVP